MFPMTIAARFLCAVSSAILPASDPAELRATVARAVEWIERQAAPLEGEEGALLFVDPQRRNTRLGAAVYGGSAGALLFLENAAAVLDDARARTLADGIAKGLRATQQQTRTGELTWMPDGMREGATALYAGDAGVGAAFLARARLRDDDEALELAVAIGDSIVARGTAEEDRLSWDQQVEIIFGAAGTLLFLLDLGEASGEESFVAAAQAAAHWLIAQAQVSHGGADGQQRLLHWRWQLAGNQPYVNFSHGSAGVAYALARVAAVTGDEACARAARDGAEWLLAQSLVHGDGLAWPVIAGAPQTMGGWCHGPPGTARLFLLLHAQSGEARYLDAALAGARFVMAQAPREAQPADADPRAAAPAAFPPSFCCGVAGVLDFFCDLHRVTGAAEHAAFAARAGDWLVQAAVADGAGVLWHQGATHDPSSGGGDGAASVDLMLGAAGEALALLRLATLAEARDPVRHLPDRAVR
ncbi:MAG: hypothetical protein JNL90_11725 [Planctomycetes bacterium]|nr:hypothetical protein [Planctomycetota bacterium]